MLIKEINVFVKISQEWEPGRKIRKQSFRTAFQKCSNHIRKFNQLLIHFRQLNHICFSFFA